MIVIEKLFTVPDLPVSIERKEGLA